MKDGWYHARKRTNKHKELSMREFTRKEKAKHELAANVNFLGMFCLEIPVFVEACKCVYEFIG